MLCSRHHKLKKFACQIPILENDNCKLRCYHKEKPAGQEERNFDSLLPGYGLI